MFEDTLHPKVWEALEALEKDRLLEVMLIAL